MFSEGFSLPYFTCEVPSSTRLTFLPSSCYFFSLLPPLLFSKLKMFFQLFRHSLKEPKTDGKVD